MFGSRICRVGVASLVLVVGRSAADSPPANPPTTSSPPAEIVPLGRDGQPLNLDFERGSLAGWLAEGEAFNGQPVEGDLIQARRPDMASGHQGQFWVGSFERGGDPPQGTLTSAPFRVTAPWASFLVAGGSTEATCVELVRQDDGEVIFRAAGQNVEDLRAVVVDLAAYQGQELFVRLVDRASGGWGHVNFDHFRLHAERPSFPAERLLGAVDVLEHAGLDPEAAARAMSVPPGFQVTLAAAEPDVRQPIAMCFDDRGRLWVAEAYSYPARVPDDQARDRILIFDDTDGDGRFDQRKVFVDNLNLVSGLELGFGGVWVGAAPYLLFIPDRDGDDRPDGPAEVLLDGWAYQDTHETLNAFNWGPDGWLYGCHGVFTHSLVGRPGTPKEQRQPLNAGIWRYHPTRHAFEVFAHGTSNPWGVDFDDHGQALATACVIPHLFHIIQGARYQRQAGEHFNRHTYADIPTIADHVHWLGSGPHAGNDRSDSAGGGHAHCGALIYLGDAWPAEYRGSILMNNIHGARLNRDLLEPRGSGLVGRHGPDFLLANDRWSQIVALRMGPDGQLYFIDWYDRNQCHRLEREVHDASNGRVFQVSHGPPRRVAPQLDEKSPAELVELQLSPNEWFVRHARRRLQERGPDPAVHQRAWELVQSDRDEPPRLRALWTLHVTGGLSEERALALLDDRAPSLRAWAIQLACEAGPPSSAILAKLAHLAAGDPAPRVRLYLASALGRLPLDDRWEIATGLVAHGEDADDHNLPLVIWYGLEPLAERDAARALTLASGGKIPLLARHMVRRIASLGTPEAIALLIERLGEVDDAREQLDLLSGLRAALRGRRQVEMPPGWTQAGARLDGSPDAAVRDEARALAVTFGDPAAIAATRERLGDATLPAVERLAALNTLVGIKDPELAPVLHVLLAEPALRAAALQALGGYDHPDTPERILALYGQLDTPQKRDALAALAGRPTYAERLLAAVAAGTIPKADLGAEVLRQLRNLKAPEIVARVAEVYGVVRDTPADKAARIVQFRRLVTRPAATPADPSLGRAVFVKTCQQCHKLFAVGGTVGPELTGSNRADLEYLLSNVLDPSAVMAKEYIPSVIVTSDGRVITGIVKSSDDQALTVATANETLTIPRGEIDELATSDKSMMPDDLWAQLPPDDVRHLVAYLARPSQVPLAATPDNVAGFFNGRDLAGWQGDPALWSVVAGEIVGRGSDLARPAYLASELAVADFRLTVSVRLVGNQGQSGIAFRSQLLSEGELRGPRASIGPGSWGRLDETGGRGLLWEQAADHHVRPDAWNQYVIEAVGPRIRTWINGQPCVDLDDPAGPRRGIIAWQLPAGAASEIRLKDLRLELVPPASVAGK